MTRTEALAAAILAVLDGWTLVPPAAPAEGLFSEAEAPRSLVSRADEWIALTDPPEIADHVLDGWTLVTTAAPAEGAWPVAAWSDEPCNRPCGHRGPHRLAAPAEGLGALRSFLEAIRPFGSDERVLSPSMVDKIMDRAAALAASGDAQPEADR